MRADVNGRKIDLRYGGYWEMGAEVLMRGGEDREHTSMLSQMEENEEEQEAGAEGEDSKERRERKRLLRAAKNREQVRAYYETLVHLHPWSRLHPNKMGALDFYPALFGFEMEACFAKQKYGVEELERQPLEDDDLPLEEDRFGREEDDMDMEMEIDPFTHNHSHSHSHGQQQSTLDPLRSSPPLLGYYASGQGGGILGDNVHPLYRSELEEDERRARRPEVRLRREKDKLRLKALEQMRDVARRMDGVMENSPYNKDVEMLRLRAMVALYVGDLSVPVSASEFETRTEDGEQGEGGDGWKSHEERIMEEEGKRAQAAERERARVLLMKIKEMRGGELEEGDELILEMLSGGGDGEDGDMEEERGRGTFSLPLR